MTNTSDKSLVIRVKTSQPSGYYVNPNQLVLGTGEEKVVAISLTKEKKTALLNDRSVLKNEKHSFLFVSQVFRTHAMQSTSLSNQ